MNDFFKELTELNEDLKSHDPEDGFDYSLGNKIDEFVNKYDSRPLIKVDVKSNRYRCDILGLTEAKRDVLVATLEAHNCSFPPNSEDSMYSVTSRISVYVEEGKILFIMNKNIDDCYFIPFARVGASRIDEEEDRKLLEIPEDYFKLSKKDSFLFNLNRFLNSPLYMTGYVVSALLAFINPVISLPLVISLVAMRTPYIRGKVDALIPPRIKNKDKNSVRYKLETLRELAKEKEEETRGLKSALLSKRYKHTELKNKCEQGDMLYNTLLESEAKLGEELAEVESFQFKMYMMGSRIDDRLNALDLVEEEVAKRKTMAQEVADLTESTDSLIEYAEEYRIQAQEEFMGMVRKLESDCAYLLDYQQELCKLGV